VSFAAIEIVDISIRAFCNSQTAVSACSRVSKIAMSDPGVALFDLPVLLGKMATGSCPETRRAVLLAEIIL
jgi:hypothetical protein